MSNIIGARQALIARILEGTGFASRDQRRAAFKNAALDEPLSSLIAKVAQRPHEVADGDIAAARAAGFSEDQIFELVVCGAVGQATRQQDTALAALRDAAGKV